MSDHYSVSITLGSWQVLQVIASPEDIGKIIGLMIPEMERRLTQAALQSVSVQIWKAPA